MLRWSDEPSKATAARWRRSIDQPADRGRGQVEPIAALVALLAVGAGIAMYAGVVAQADPGAEPRETAAIALERVHDDLVVGGVADPDRLTLPPELEVERRAGVELTSGEHRWTAGGEAIDPPYPEDATVAKRSVSVRVSPGDRVRGTLRVVVRR